MLEGFDQVVNEIDAAVVARRRDLGSLERTLTDGYAHALALEAERTRLQRRLTEVAQAIGRGELRDQAQELVRLAERLEGNSGDLVRLRGSLAQLRRHADTVRGSA